MIPTFLKRLYRGEYGFTVTGVVMIFSNLGFSEFWPYIFIGMNNVVSNIGLFQILFALAATLFWGWASMLTMAVWNSGKASSSNKLMTGLITGYAAIWAVASLIFLTSASGAGYFGQVHLKTVVEADNRIAALDVSDGFTMVFIQTNAENNEINELQVMLDRVDIGYMRTEISATFCHRYKLFFRVPLQKIKFYRGAMTDTAPQGTEEFASTCP